jgi:hypothetical protein
MGPPKKKAFRASKEVKRRARRDLGLPPPTRRLENRKKKPSKYKKLSVQAEEDGLPVE